MAGNWSGKVWRGGIESTSAPAGEGPRAESKRRDPPAARERRVGHHLEERNEDEGTLVHPGVRDLQVRLVDLALVVREDVDVDGPGSPRLDALPSERVLHLP